MLPWLHPYWAMLLADTCIIILLLFSSVYDMSCIIFVAALGWWAAPACCICIARACMRSVSDCNLIVALALQSLHLG